MLGSATPAKRLRNAAAMAGRAFSTGQWWLFPQGDPSFLLSYQRHRRNYARALDLLGRPWGSLWPWEDKYGCHLFAERVGIPTPRLLQGPVHIEDVDWHPLPDSFVVKPTRGAGKAGVFLLKRRGEHFRDILRDGMTTPVQIVKSVIDASLRGDVSADSVIVEEALLAQDGRGVNDWKCYAFQGEVLLVWQIARTKDGRRSKYYDGSWKDLGPVRHRTRVERSLRPPQHPHALIAAAERISQALPVPFARIDLYEHNDRVLLGEITPMPGSRQRFRREVDRAMGEAWERAEGRLLARSQDLTWPDPR